MELAALIVSGISALASEISAWKKVGTSSKDFTEKKIDEIYETESRRIEEDIESSSSSTESSAAELLHITIDPIDPEILETIKREIDKAKTRLKLALSNSNNSNEIKNKEIDIASSTICAELARIKRLNGGELPHEELDKDWNMCNCGS